MHRYVHINITHFTNLRSTVKRYRQNSVECRYKKDSLTLIFFFFILNLCTSAFQVARETYIVKGIKPHVRCLFQRLPVKCFAVTVIQTCAFNEKDT